MTYAERIPSTDFPASNMRDSSIAECRRIVDIAQSEIERRRERADIYGRQCIMDLHDIVWAATAVEDYITGAADEPQVVRELDSLLTEWAEDTDYRTFGATPALDALDLGAVWGEMLHEGRAFLGGERR
jgi:hypothetical protein